MDILGLVVGALLGTLVMTGVMETAQAARLTRISIPFMLGAMVSERRATIRVAGFAMHLVNGLIFRARLRVALRGPGPIGLVGGRGRRRASRRMRSWLGQPEGR